MTRSLILVTLALALLYGTIKSYSLIAGPSLSIESPAAYTQVEGGTLFVRGVARRVAHLSLNGAPLLRDQQDNFSSMLTFPHGTSILTFEASDRFGRRVKETRTILVP